MPLQLMLLCYFWLLMGAQSGFIDVGNEKLHYLRWGSGAALLLCFHGYGRVAGSMEPFVAHLVQHYTIISIDLPYHGGSAWKPGGTLQPQALHAGIMTLMQAHGVSRFSLLGYSIGGMVCLHLVAHLPQHIGRVTLLAPDGLTRNLFYYFFTSTSAGRLLFVRALTRHQPYIGVAATLHRSRLISANLYNLVSHYLTDDDKRLQLRYAWPALRLLAGSPAAVRTAMHTHGLHMHIFMGRYDKIIPALKAVKFKSGHDNVQIHILDKGHRIYDAGNAEQIARTLL